MGNNAVTALKKFGNKNSENSCPPFEDFKSDIFTPSSPAHFKRILVKGQKGFFT